MIFDLHSHSTASDGVLSPRELVARASAQGVQYLALTDHDDIRGLAEAREAVSEYNLNFVPGVEISVTWVGSTVHIVGLHVDSANPALLSGLAANRSGRLERARLMAESLAKTGISGAYEGAYRLAANKELISRTHFARYLVDTGRVKNLKSVFKKFLIKGKPGYVSHQWAKLNDAIDWIRGAGGIAVLAHPGRYDMGKQKMRLLLGAFKEAGGTAIEVVTGSHTPDQVPVMAGYAREFGLMASCGSDFHAPGEGGRELGRLTPLPAGCTPVWQGW